MVRSIKLVCLLFVVFASRSTTATSGAATPTVATEGTSPITVPTEGTSPITVPTEATSPITVPTEATSPITVPTEETSPITVPTEATSPITVPTEATSPQTVPTEATSKPGPTDDSAKPPTADATTKPGLTDEPTKPPPATKPPPGACATLNPCGKGSTCQDRPNDEFVCLCPFGESYDVVKDECFGAKVFPGELTLKGEVYTPEMAKPTSNEFKTAAAKVEKELNTTYLKEPGYLGSVVIKLSPATRTKAEAVVATVDIMFDQNSAITPKDVKEKVPDTLGTLIVKKICDARNPCDTATTTCKGDETDFNCTCKAGYIETEFADRLCVAACANGQTLDGETKKCIPCGFGKTGFNCQDEWQLILTIVGSVLGGLLLISIILLPVVAMMSKKKLKKAKASSSYDKPKSNPAPAKSPQVSNGLAAPRPSPVKATPAGGLGGYGANGIPRIPRATTNDSWDRNTNLEMVPSNSRQNLLPSSRNSRRFDDDDDSPYYSRPKPQNNPYAMARPQGNPYASNQGNSNPYYRH